MVSGGYLSLQFCMPSNFCPCRVPPNHTTDHASPGQEETLLGPGSLWSKAHAPRENEGEPRAGKLFSRIFLLRFKGRVERGKVVHC